MKTKLIISLGPSTSSPEVMKQVIKEGINALRINTAHGDPKEWKALINNARKLTNAPIIMDLVGHSIRYTGKEVTLKKNDEIKINESELNNKIINELKEGTKLIINEGKIIAKVTKNNKNSIIIKSLSNGLMNTNSKITVPGLNEKIPLITDSLMSGIKVVNELKIEFIALSYTQFPSEIKQLRKLAPNAGIIAKIENALGVKNHKEIIKEADALMIARGDLGIELQLKKVPLIQKEIINDCNNEGKPVIVATQILESMINNSEPTRAEVSDIANAILDGADTLMLSGETTIGNNPASCVKVIHSVANEVEQGLKIKVLIDDKKSISQAITNLVQELSRKLSVTKVITITRSGYTARMIARHRIKAQIISFTNNDLVKNNLSITYGVIPLLINKDSLSINEVINESLSRKLINENDLIIFAGGFNTKEVGITNMIQLNTGKSLLKK